MAAILVPHGARHGVVMAAIIGLHVGVFLLIAVGLGPRAFEPLVKPPLPIVQLPPRDVPIDVEKPPAGALIDPYSVQVDEPRIPLPRFEENTPLAVSQDPRVEDAAGAGTSVPTPHHHVGPQLRTRDRRLAALIDACYPAPSRRLGEEGRVIASVTIGIDGRAGQWHVVQSSGFARLDEAVGCIIEHLAFVPGRRDGRAAEAEAMLPIAFRLN